jgi:SAM-dependent methyltransferase
MLPRPLKRLAVRALSPLDAVVRRVNGKSHLPPLHLRWDVGPLRGFESSAAEYRMLLQLLGGLRPGSRVLDIGCGCGQIALELMDRLDGGGRYEGWDISPEAIAWCRKAITGRDARFTFRVLDVRNGMYNPSGREDAASFRFPASGPFDLVLLKSVFTHMLRPEVENYLRQIPGLLAPGGRCLASCFLTGPERQAIVSRGQPPVRFQPYRDGTAVARAEMPEAIIAVQEDVMMDLVRRAGLTLERPVVRGGWAGDPAALTHQDLLVLERSA